MKFPTCGYLYIARGDKYIKEAIISAESLRKVDIKAHITLITDKKFNHQVFNYVMIKKRDKFRVNSKISDDDQKRKSGFFYKSCCLIHSPYKKTLFVDTDTFFTAKCKEVFRLLDFFDLCIALAPNFPVRTKINSSIFYGYHSYNTGVIAYKNNFKVRSFLKKWIKIYKNNLYYIDDQSPFMEALLYKSLKIYVLQNIYNFRTHVFAGFTSDKIKIIHGRGVNYELIKKTCNLKLENRAWDPIKKSFIYR